MDSEIREIRQLMQHKGWFYSTLPVQPTKALLSKSDKSTLDFKRKDYTFIAEKVMRKPSIGQLARKFGVNKVTIKKALGLHKERPEAYRMYTVSGRALNIPASMIKIKLPNDPNLRQMAEATLKGMGVQVE